MRNKILYIAMLIPICLFCTQYLSILGEYINGDINIARAGFKFKQYSFFQLFIYVMFFYFFWWRESNESDSDLRQQHKKNKNFVRILSFISVIIFFIFFLQNWSR